MTTITYVVATGFSLLFITWCAIFIVLSYTRAAIRVSSERATRAGVATYTNTKDVNAAIVACSDTFDDDLSQALPASVRMNISSQCSSSAGDITVVISSNLKSVTAGIPGFNINEQTTRDLEQLP